MKEEDKNMLDNAGWWSDLDEDELSPEE